VTATAGNSNDAIFSMRAQTQSFGGSQPAVVPYFADVPILSQANIPFFDLASVQVLKGPQGTLFGRNTTGGAILFTPVRPSNSFGGEADLQVGDYDFRQAQLALNLRPSAKA
jgi:iron complex outermembrane receptor protein